MKKIVALLLAMLVLAGSLTALAEGNASIVRISDMALSYVSGDRARSARFGNASLTLALGMSENAPTLQMMFESDYGQAVDAVVQLVEENVLFSMGGLSATFALDLDHFSTPDNSGEDMAKGLSAALSVAGSHLDVVLYALTRDEGNGMRSVSAPLPMPQLIRAAEAILAAGAGEDEQDTALDELRDRVASLEGEAMMGFRYNLDNGQFELSAVQNGTGMRLSGTMAMSFEPMTFIDTTPEYGEVWDLMNMTPEQQETLRGELQILFPKLLAYADGTGMGGIMP